MLLEHLGMRSSRVCVLSSVLRAAQYAKQEDKPRFVSKGRQNALVCAFHSRSTAMTFSM